MTASNNRNRKYFRDIYSKKWVEIRPDLQQEQSHAMYLSITLENLQCFDGASILECGCGSGELLRRLDEKYQDLQITGIDLGYESLLSAQSKLVQNPNALLIEGDIIELPFAADSFDRILCSSVLWYLPKPSLAIDEMIRVLRPNGRLVFDVRPPFHITNILTRLSLLIRGLWLKDSILYSFQSPKELSKLLAGYDFEMVGFFVLLPTQLPFLGKRFGNWVRISSCLSFRAGRGRLLWISQKLLVTLEKRHKHSSSSFLPKC